MGKSVSLEIPDCVDLAEHGDIAALHSRLLAARTARHETAQTGSGAEPTEAAVDRAHDEIIRIERAVAATDVNKETLNRYLADMVKLSCCTCDIQASDEIPWMLMVQLSVDCTIYAIPVSNEHGPDLCRSCYRVGCRLHPGKSLEAWVGSVLQAPSATEIFRAAKQLFDTLPDQPFSWVPSDVHIQSVTGLKVVTPGLFLETPEWTKRFRSPAEAFGLTTSSVRCESNQTVEGTIVRDGTLSHVIIWLDRRRPSSPSDSFRSHFFSTKIACRSAGARWAKPGSRYRRIDLYCDSAVVRREYPLLTDFFCSDWLA